MRLQTYFLIWLIVVAEIFQNRFMSKVCLLGWPVRIQYCVNFFPILMKTLLQNSFNSNVVLNFLCQQISIFYRFLIFLCDCFLNSIVRLGFCDNDIYFHFVDGGKFSLCRQSLWSHSNAYVILSWLHNSTLFVYSLLHLTVGETESKRDAPT